MFCVCVFLRSTAGRLPAVPVSAQPPAAPASDNTKPMPNLIVTERVGFNAGSWHTTVQFRDEPFRASDCTGIDNQIHTYTRKIKKQTKKPFPANTRKL